MTLEIGLKAKICFHDFDRSRFLARLPSPLRKNLLQHAYFNYEYFNTIKKIISVKKQVNKEIVFGL